MATSTDLRAAIEEVQNQLPAEGAQEEVLGYEQDWLRNIERRVGALPWWIISAVVHAVLFLLITLLAVALPTPVQDEVIISTDVAKEKPPEYDEKKPRDIFKNPNEIQAETMVENPILVHEQVEVSDHFETDNDMDQQTSRGQEDAISDIPLGGTGISGSIGVGGGGMGGCFGYRNGGGRRNAVGRFGGSPATESAVEAALQWLKRHQDAEGFWDVEKWEGGTAIPGTALTGAKDKSLDISITGLAVLAYLGAGYTHKTGPYKDTVDRAVRWLVSQQRPSGAFEYEGFGESPHNGYQVYDHAIGTLALAEAYGMTQDAELLGPAQRGVDNLLKLQAAYGAWQHTTHKSMSVSGWGVMALKSARTAGLKVDAAGFQGAANWIEKCTDPKRGTVSYNESSRGRSSPFAKLYLTTAAGMVCRQFMGVPNTDETLRKGADYLVQELPVWQATNNPKQTPQWPYYWYYGTLTMFQMGGDYWTKWNEALKSTLVPNQRKGGPLDGSKEDVDGSWDCEMGFGPTGGRAYTTAVNALSLEVYYRYLPMYTK